MLQVISADGKSLVSTLCWSRTLSSECLSHRPAAGRRAGQEPAGTEPGAGAGTAADVFHQPGAAAGDRGRDGHVRQVERQPR